MKAQSDTFMRSLFMMTMAGAVFLLPAHLSAQTCGTDYTLKPGDTLADIAHTVYGKASQWSVIYYANQDRLGDGTTLLVPGLSLRDSMSCRGSKTKCTCTCRDGPYWWCADNPIRGVPIVFNAQAD